MVARTEPEPGRGRSQGSGERELVREPGPAAYVLLAALAIVWTWWALREGAFFGVVFHPGSIVLYGVTVVLLLTTPWRGKLRLSPGALAALTAIALLAVWTLLSAFWSPSPDIAVGDAQHAFLYATAFALGLWLTLLLTPRITLSLLPLAVAATVAGIVTVITLLVGDDLSRYVAEEDGTLRFPLGYRNANAAFFLISIWPIIALAAERGLDWRLRGVLLGAGTLCLDLALMGQSRGSVPAVAVALAVYVILTPNRLRALAWLGLAIVPMIPAVPSLLDVYQPLTEGRVTLPPLRAGAGAAGLSAAAAVGIGMLAARFEPARERSADAIRTTNRAVAIGGVATVLAGVVAFVILLGSPIAWINERVEEIRAGGSPDLQGGSTRFAADARSYRSDTWRVAWDQARDAPLGGGGAGSFQYRYALERDSDRTPRDAHSVELELLSELGTPGLLLFATFAVGAGAAAIRSRRVSPTAATLSTAALAGAACWLVQASVDWFWTYPALTAPVIALLGAAAAPAVLKPDAELRRRARVLLGLGAILLALTAVPPFLSERYTNHAYGTWGTDLDRAYADLDRAQSLNRLSDDPLIAEGAIAREAGDRGRAIDAFRRAAERTPEEWASHYVIAVLLADRDPGKAQAELDIALRLNPKEAALRRLRERIERGPP